MVKKLIILTALIVLIGLFFYFDLSSYLNLDYLKESQNRFQQLYQQHRMAVLGAYAAIYIIVTALSLPGAAVMTLAGGALFGLLIAGLLRLHRLCRPGLGARPLEVRESRYECRCWLTECFHWKRL